LLQRRAAQFARAWQEMVSTRFLIYQRLFPWFLSEMLAAGWPKDSAAVKEVLRRAHAEWKELTGLRPLCDYEAWLAATRAAGFTPAEWRELEWREAGEHVLAWAETLRAEKARQAGATHVDRLESHPAETPDHKRNAWLYEQCCKGTAYKSIIRKLRKKPKSWERIETAQGIRAAVKRYLENRPNLAPPPARQKGRRVSKK